MRLTKFVLAAAFLISASVNRTSAQETTEWPDIPLLTVTTEDGAFPTCDVIYPPEGCVGTGITNAEYVPGKLVMTLKGDTLYDSGEYVKDESGMRMKIRGNSTGATVGQKPYKIKLSKKFDLLCRGDKDYKEKDWNLLKICTWNPGLEDSESDMLTYLGFIVSKAVGMEWTPGCQFVNLVMNDKYMGMYCMTDAVERGDKRMDIKKSGFLVESDAYWWNEDVYFKTEHQPSLLGYTFKYPDSDDVDEQTIAIIQGYLNTFENALYTGGDVAEYIDLSMFAKWILAHDILNSGDEVGTNMYVYKDDYDEENPTSTKLKMGSLWDFDSAFKNPEDSDKWSKVHESPYFYWPELFKRDDFVQAYRDEWAAIKDSLLDKVIQGFDELKTTYGSSLDESMKMHNSIYPDECLRSVQEQIDELTGKVRDRIEALDFLMSEFESTGIENVDVSIGTELVEVFDMYGMKYNTTDVKSLPSGIYIERYSDGTTRKVLNR